MYLLKFEPLISENVFESNSETADRRLLGPYLKFKVLSIFFKYVSGSLSLQTKPSHNSVAPSTN